MSETASHNDVIIIKGSNRLKRLVGNTTFDHETVKDAQNHIDTCGIDFTGEAKTYLDDLKKALKAAQKEDKDDAICIENIRYPVMNLKAQSAMFQYDLASSLAGIVLDLLEETHTLDQKLIHILVELHKSLSAIFKKQMIGAGGNLGKRLICELEAQVEIRQRSLSLSS